MYKERQLVKYGVLRRRVKTSLLLGGISTLVFVVLTLVLGRSSTAAAMAGVIAIFFLMYAVGLKDADTMIYREEHKDAKKSGTQ
jgi:hypothetical protein